MVFASNLPAEENVRIVRHGPKWMEGREPMRRNLRIDTDQVELDAWHYLPEGSDAWFARLKEVRRSHLAGAESTYAPVGGAP